MSGITDPQKQNISEINLRRLLIGLSTVEEQNRNNEINIDRRKIKAINTKIILE